MPTKRMFDLVIIASLLLHPAVGLVRLEVRRHARESDGVLGKVGRALTVGL